MSTQAFRELLKPITDVVGGNAVDAELEADLERRFPPAGATFEAVEAACHEAIAQGWMCGQGGPGRRFGRVIEAGPATGGVSVDVVDLSDIAGPRHRHPNGEVLMIMPQTPRAKFDGRGAGWMVYAPGSAHRPTVSEGRALVLYMLPGGEIEFTD